MIAVPLVSVVIPAFNAAKHIRETIDSVLAQTYRAIEIIVVDDGSTDETRERILACGSRVRYVWQPNSGKCSSPRNHGVRVASGEFLAFLDADDLIAPDRIDAAVVVMTRHPDTGLALTNFTHFDSAGVDPTDHFATCSLLGAHLEGRRHPADAVVLPPAVSTEILLVENFGSSAPIVRRDAFIAAGGFDETLPAGSEDYDLNYRIAERFPIAVVPGVLMHKRRHDANMTTHPDRMLHSQIPVRHKMLAAASDSARAPVLAKHARRVAPRAGVLLHRPRQPAGSAPRGARPVVPPPAERPALGPDRCRHRRPRHQRRAVRTRERSECRGAVMTAQAVRLADRSSLSPPTRILCVVRNPVGGIRTVPQVRVRGAAGREVTRRPSSRCGASKAGNSRAISRRLESGASRSRRTVRRWVC